MGSSSKFDYSDYRNPEIKNNLKKIENEAEFNQYETEVNEHLNIALSEHNNRDADAISFHIKAITRALQREIDGSISTRFGGSISKHTYVEGFSDVDTLIILNNTELANESPDEVLNYFYDWLKNKFNKHKITKGDTAITIEFKDAQIQLLPALKYKSGIKIPDGSDWSNIVNPNKFAENLTSLNQSLQGRLIPTIKLVKGINATLPEDVQLKSYHIESLAVQIFERKKDAGIILTNKEMIMNFFKEASQNLRSPIKDTSLQSKYVDEYLGGKDSVKRARIADFLDRTYRKLELADLGRMTSVWDDLTNFFK